MNWALRTDSRTLSQHRTGMRVNQILHHCQKIQLAQIHSHWVRAQKKTNGTPFNCELEIPEDIAALIETLLQKEEHEDVEIYCTILDFAGQSVFHPLFLTHRGIYLLDHDLNRDPRERADFLVTQGSFKKVHDANLVRFVISGLLQLRRWPIAGMTLLKKDQLHCLLSSSCLPMLTNHSTMNPQEI